MNSEDNSLSRFFEESRPDGTWLTWRKALNQQEAEASSSGAGRPATSEPAASFAKEPRGTLFVGQFLGENFARLMEPKIPASRAKDAAAVVQSLRTIGRVEARTRWQDGWLVGELHGAGKASKTGARFEPSLPGPATRLSSMGPSPGQMSLERAVAKTRELLFALGNVKPSERVALLATHQEELERELETARQDPATKGEAVALMALLAALPAFPTPQRTVARSAWPAVACASAVGRQRISADRRGSRSHENRLRIA